MAKRGVELCLSKLLLPAPTWYETAWSALRGVASTAWSKEDRDALESMISKGIIQDQVLHNSRHHSQVSPGGNGALLSMSLFDSLYHNPLWKKYNFDALEFCHAVGPALTNFHDLVFELQNQESKKIQEREEPETPTKRETSSETKEEESEEKIFSRIVEQVLQGGIEPDLLQSVETTWIKEAKENPDSVVASVVEMATPTFLQHLHDSTVREALFRKKYNLPALSAKGQPLDENGSSGGNESSLSFTSSYVKGSAKINQVAILRARAMEVDFNDDYRYEEFRASDPDFDKPKPVAAQIDVLFEITCRFRESFALKTLADMVMNNHLGESWKDGENGGDSSKKDELVQYTRLGVAVLEGWLHNVDENNNELRWRVPMLREPVEFSLTGIDSTVRTVIDEKEEQRKAQESSGKP